MVGGAVRDELLDARCSTSTSPARPRRRRRAVCGRPGRRSSGSPRSTAPGASRSGTGARSTSRRSRTGSRPISARATSRSTPSPLPLEGGEVDRPARRAWGPRARAPRSLVERLRGRSAPAPSRPPRGRARVPLDAETEELRASASRVAEPAGERILGELERLSPAGFRRLDDLGLLEPLGGSLERLDDRPQPLLSCSSSAAH